MARPFGFFAWSLLALVGCREPAAAATETGAAPPSAAPSEHGLASSDAAKSQPAASPARVGQQAPDFELSDLEGKKVRLRDLRGKVVVLEWFNPGCPFVRAAHTKGSLVDLAARLGKEGVVYLAINSSAPGKQGHGAAENRAGARQLGITHPIVLDETGRVGRLYGATNTPHGYVIDAKGTLVYRGAIDNSPDGEGESPAGGALVRYLEDAVVSTLAGQPVRVPETKAYGCSVKYP